MIYIAHRGLFEGPDKQNENHPDQIELALSRGFNCEIDVWYDDGEWWLGHDWPTYKIGANLLADSRLWAHCKNVDAMQHCPNPNRFWHDIDGYTFTKSGFIWTYPGYRLVDDSICVMPEWEHSPGVIPGGSYYGICSDYVGLMVN